MSSNKRPEQEKNTDNEKNTNIQNNIHNDNTNVQNGTEDLNKKEDVTITNFISKSSHPITCIFTLSFKIGAIVAFILLDLFVTNEAIAYLVVIILSAADFWTIKNISGRILVGLRWWNEVKDDGDEVWIFESKNESKKFYKKFIKKNY